MSDMRRLFVDTIETIGFVGAGDNPPAEIVFFKRKSEDTKVANAWQKFIKAFAPKAGMSEAEVKEILETETGEDKMTFDVNKMSKEDRAAFDAAVAAAVAAAKPSDTVPESVTKALADMEKAVKAATDRADKAEGRVQEMEKSDERQKYIKRATSLRLPGAQADDFAEILRKADAALSPEERQKLDEVLKGASAAIDETMFIELGRGNGGIATSLEAEVTKLANEYKTKDPTLSEQMARALVWKNHPALYERNRVERASALKTAED